MCGRFTQQRPSAELAALFAADDLAATPGGRFNLAPQQSGLVVVERPDERRAIVAYRWGLVPTWAKDARIGNRLINARAETVATTPAFRSAFQKRRCLVPRGCVLRVGARRPVHPPAEPDPARRWRANGVRRPLVTLARPGGTGRRMDAHLHDRHHHRELHA